MSATIGSFPSHVHRILIAADWLVSHRIYRLTAFKAVGPESVLGNIKGLKPESGSGWFVSMS